MYETKNCPIFWFAKQTFFRGDKSRMSKYVTGPLTWSKNNYLDSAQVIARTCAEP